MYACCLVYANSTVGFSPRLQFAYYEQEHQTTRSSNIQVNENIILRLTSYKDHLPLKRSTLIRRLRTFAPIKYPPSVHESLVIKARILQSLRNTNFE